MVQIGLFLLYNNCMRQVEAQAQQQYLDKELIGHANWFSTLVSTATLSLTAYVRTKRSQNLSSYRSETDKIRAELGTLESLTKNDADLRRQYSQLSTVARSFLAQLRGIESEATDGLKTQAQADLDSSTFSKTFADLFQCRSKLLQTVHKRNSDKVFSDPRRQQTEHFIFLGIGINVMTAILLIGLFSRNISRRLEVLSDNTVRLAMKRPLNAISTGRDEIAHLDQTFHSMAEALNAAAKRERAVLQQAADVICSFDAHGRIKEINPACLSSWGYEPNELIGNYFVDYVSSKFEEQTLNALSQGAKSEESFSFENEIKRKDGSAVIIRWSAVFSQLDRTFFCVAHDITKQKYVEQLKAQFMNMVSHDLRSPLNSISAFLELFCSGTFGTINKTGTQSAAAAQKSCKRLIKLVNDLLDLERLESSAFPLELVKVDIKEVVEEAEYSIRQLASDANVILDDSQVSSQLVEIDAARITQVLVNLISNAIKFSPPNSMIMLLTTRIADRFEFSVIDSGRGIPEGMKCMLFDRFSQVEMRDSHRGSGLGLAISKAIVEQHGGRIGVDSRVGQGSRFWFTLPVSADSQPPEEIHSFAANARQQVALSESALPPNLADACAIAS
jgi:PAS domain S-box-containing protein